MKIFLTLIKNSLNVNFGFSVLKYRFAKDRGKLWETAAIGLGVLFGGGSLLVGYSILLVAMFAVGLSIHQPEIILTMSFMSAQLLVLLFGIFYIMSSFYFSNDLSLLIPLPVKPSYVLGSKFITVMVNEYITLLPLLLPPIIIYGFGTGKGLFYWIKGLLLLLSTPVIPLIIAALFVVLLMRIVNIHKSKDLFVIIGTLFAIILGVGVNFFTQKIPEGNESQFIEQLLTGQSALIQNIGAKFPPSLWATYGLSKPGLEGFTYILLFLGISALLFFILLWMGNQLFYKSLLSGQEVIRKRRSLSQKEIDHQMGKLSSPIIALFRREWKLFLRTPIYAMNGLAGMIMMPFLMAMPFFTKNDEMAQMLDFLQKPSSYLPSMLGGIGFTLFVSSVNLVASTAISREGSTFWVSKMIPVSPSHQVMGKILHAISISLIGIFIMTIGLTVILRLSFFRILILLILSITGSILIAILHLIIDVLHPKLEWTNPQQAVKQNMNGFFGILITVVVIAFLGALSAIMILFHLQEILIYLVLLMVISSLIYPSYRGLSALAEYRYKQLEI